MANRYWVGGTASWDGTAGTKWATTSGGTGGASVPTSADDVFFDASSGASTVTIATGNTGAKSINCTGFTGTITGTADITVSGSVTLVAGMTYSHTGIVTFNATGTLTTAGKTFSAVTVNGSGITLTLGDALNTSTRDITITQGTFTTSASNYNVTANSIISSNSNSRTITLNASTISLGGSIPIDFTTSTNLTFNANTSQINLTRAAPVVQGGGQTFYNVSCTTAISASGVISINGTNTFNNLTLTAPSGSGFGVISFSANQTINGTLTVNSTTVLKRYFFRSNTIGTTRTLTVNSLSAPDCDFRDITLAGTASGTSPTRAGDCGGNSGITFPTPKTVYRVGTDTTWAGSSSWATSSGGTGSDNNLPLAQDTAIINNDTALTGTLALAAYNIGELDCSNRTSAITLNYNASATWYGSHALGSGVTVSGTSSQTFSGRKTILFTSAGKAITFYPVVDAPNGTFKINDAFNGSGIYLNLIRGTLDASSYNVTILYLSSNNSNVRTLTMGSGLWTLAGTSTVWDFTTSTNLTTNKNTANILLSDTGTTSRTFNGGGQSYNKITIGGSTGIQTTVITGANTFTEIAATKSVAHTITFSANQTIGTWSVTGSSGNVVTVNSNAVGTRRTITLTNATSGIDYLSVKDIGVNAGSLFYVGANSTDGGNNLNVVFTAAPSGANVSFAITEPQDTSALGVSAQNQAALSANDPPDTVAIVLAREAQASLAASENTDALSASVSAKTDATLTATEALDTASIAVTSQNRLSFSVTETADTASFTARAVTNAAADLAASSAVSASAQVVISTAANLVAASTVTPAAVLVREVAAASTGSSAVTASGTADYVGQAAIAADSTVEPFVLRLTPTSAAFLAASTLTANARFLWEGEPSDTGTWAAVPSVPATWTPLATPSQNWTPVSH